MTKPDSLPLESHVLGRAKMHRAIEALKIAASQLGDAYKELVGVTIDGSLLSEVSQVHDAADVVLKRLVGVRDDLSAAGQLRAFDWVLQSERGGIAGWVCVYCMQPNGDEKPTCTKCGKAPDETFGRTVVRWAYVSPVPQAVPPWHASTEAPQRKGAGTEDTD